EEMHLHIAKHARRTTNAPVDTWFAVSQSKRGYKMFPHFQIGLFDDHVFVWLALIYELPHKREMAETLLARASDWLPCIPKSYVLSMDHMEKDAVSFGALSKEELRSTLARFRDVKKAEWLLGRQVMAGDPILVDGKAFIALAKETFDTLLPLYRIVR